MATPFALLTLYLEPPHAFATLFAYYFFGKTLFAYYFFGKTLFSIQIKLLQVKRQIDNQMGELIYLAKIGK